MSEKIQKPRPRFAVHDQFHESPTLCLENNDGTCRIIAEFEGEGAGDYAERCAAFLNAGFTWEDVDNLRLAQERIAPHHLLDYGFGDIADRIAVLLPPRE